MVLNSLSIADTLLEILESSLETWNEKFAEIITLLTQSPETFRGGAIWNVMLQIHGALKATGIALLVIFFLVGLMKTTINFKDFRGLQHSAGLFMRLLVAKVIVTYGMDLMLWILAMVQEIISKMLNVAGLGNGGGMAVLPDQIKQAVGEASFWASIGIIIIAAIGSLIVIALAFVMILTVYGRMFKIYMYTAISPIPLATFAGEPVDGIGKAFLKSYFGVCMEGALIVICCIIFSAFASSTPTYDPSASAAQMIWKYMGETIFNMFILVGMVKGSSRIMHEMIGG